MAWKRNKLLVISILSYLWFWSKARLRNKIPDSEDTFMLQEGLDDNSFENYKGGLMAKLLEKDPSLTYETNRFWNQIIDKRYASWWYSHAILNFIRDFFIRIMVASMLIKTKIFL